MENQINLLTVQDLWDEQDKQVPVDVTKTYDPLHFWEDYGDRYFKSYKRPQDIQKNLAWILHKITSLKCTNLLDVGCGFGRLIPFLIDGKAVSEITAIDFSPKQIASMDEYLKDYPQRDKIKVQCVSVKNTKLPDASFDCVLSSECLQHLPLPSLHYAIREMYRVTRKYVVIVERFVFDGERPQPHIWTHNYSKIVTDNGFKVLESKLIGNGIIGMILKK
jgi:ubiquinone/menaquinone biosynthesis C-methylase UbiE